MRSYLDFEKPVADLQGKVQELRSLGDAGDAVAIGDEIAKLEAKASQALVEIYAKLTPWQKTQVARHPDRPHFVDYAKALMKAQMSGTVSPLACGWATHPLILRVSLLNRREPSLTRDVTGFLTMTFLSLAAMGAVWSVAPRGPNATDLNTGMAAQMDPYTGAIVWVKSQ